MKKLLLYFLFLFSASAAFAQDTKKIKQLETTLSTAPNDSVKVYALTELSSEYADADPKKALALAKKGALIAEKNKFGLLRAECYYYIGSGLLQTGKNDSALYFFQLEKDIREEKKDTLGLAFCLRKTGDCLSQQGQHVKAVKAYIDAIRLWDSKKDFWHSANVYVDLGNIYYYQKKIDKALQYYTSAYETYLKGNDKVSSNIIQMNTAIIYLEQNQLEKSKQLFDKVSEKIMVDYRQPEVGHGYFINMAMLHTKMGDYPYAQLLLNKAAKYYSDSANSIIKLNHSSGAAEFYVRSGNYRSGLEWSKKLVAHAKEIGSLEYEKAGLNFMAKSNAGLKNYEAAYAGFLAYDSIKDSLLSTENRKQVAEMESEFQTAKKELENKSLKAEAKVKDAEIQKAEDEKKRQNILIIAFACVLLLTVAFLYFVYRNLQQNKQKNRIITEQKLEVDRAYAQLNEKNKEVLASIHYAKRIQLALMSSEKNIARKLNSVRKNKP